MKKLMLLLLVNLFCAFGLLAQTHSVTDNGSTIGFAIKNLGLTVNGSFKGLAGTVVFNPANVSAAMVNVSVDAATVNTNNGARDKHLKKEEYFWVEKYPKISFLATKITATNQPNSFEITGNISIKGITEAISFPFTAKPVADGYLLEGSFKLNRRHFNVGGSSFILSDNLLVNLSVLAKK